MITSAACRGTINGTQMVIPVHRHCDFFEIMKLLHCKYNKEEVEQGFINWDPTTKTETFVDRIEAFKLAQFYGQIPQNLPVQPLYSEDLY